MSVLSRLLFPLARRFIADEPPAAVVERASRTFLKTGGDIREVVRTILTSPVHLGLSPNSRERVAQVKPNL